MGVAISVDDFCTTFVNFLDLDQHILINFSSDAFELSSSKTR